LNFGTNNARRMIIDSSGNVGIGTTSPNKKLQVAGEGHFEGNFGGGGGKGLYLRNTISSGYTELVIDNDVVNSGGGFVFGYGGTTTANPNQAYFWNRKAGDILFGTSGVERVRVTSGGRVGIGTTTPRTHFEIYGDSLANVGSFLFDQPTAPNGTTSKGPHFFLKSAGVDRGWIGFFDTANHGDGVQLNIKSAGSIGFANGIGSVNAMTLSGGNLGIGASPSARLHVISTTEQQRIGYNVSNYYSTTVSSTGGVSFNAVGTGASFNFLDNVTVSTKIGINNSSPSSVLSIGQTSSFLSNISNGFTESLLISNTSAIGFASECLAASSSITGSFAALYSNDGAAMASGDRLGGFLLGGSSSATSLRNASLIAAFATENWVDGVRYGSSLSFETTANGATSRTQRMIIDGNGYIGIGTSSPSARLHLISTTEQQRTGYDASNYYSTTVSSTGIVTFDAVGAGASFVFQDPVSFPQGISTQIKEPVITVTTTTYTAASYTIILVDDDTAGGNVLISLPDASTSNEKQYTIKKLGTTGIVTIDPHLSQLIDGELIFELLEGKEVIRIVCDGTKWSII
jgi:hypothetical protein